MIRALVFIIETLANLFLFVLLLRFWLPWFGADFRNPIAQGILALTSPLVNPVRRYVPSLGRIDMATVLVAFAVQAVTIALVTLLIGASPGLKLIVVASLFQLLQLTVQLFLFAIIIRIVLSWFAPHTHNPATALLVNLTEPILRPLRRRVPPLGGFDISPVFAIILLGALAILLDELQRSLL